MVRIKYHVFTWSNFTAARDIAFKLFVCGVVYFSFICHVATDKKYIDIAGAIYVIHKKGSLMWPTQ